MAQRECKNCHQTYETTIGLSNWRNLFKKPTLEDWISLIIVTLVILTAYAYIHDIKVCKEVVNNLDTVCMNYFSNLSSPGYNPNYNSNLNNLPNLTIQYGGP